MNKASALQEARKIYLDGLKKGDLVRYTLFTGVTVTSKVAKVTQKTRQIVLEDGMRFDRKGFETGTRPDEARRIVTG